MTYYALSALINGISSTIFGFLIFSKNPKLLSNKLFGLMNLFISIWSYSYFFWQLSNNYEMAFSWVRTLTIALIFIPIFHLHWTLVLLNKHIIRKYFIFLSYIIGIIFIIICSFTDIWIKGLRPILNFKFWPIASPIFYLIIIFFFTNIIFSVIDLFLSRREASGHYKAQINYLLIATFIGFGGGSTSFFLWYDYLPIPPIGNILVSFYIIVISYAIVKHQLMDIQLLLRKWSVYLTSLVSVAFVSMGIKFIFNEFFFFDNYFIDLIALGLATLIYPTVKDYFYEAANKYFFTSLYDSQKVIAEISDDLKSTLDIDKIYSFIFNSLDKTFHMKAISILNNFIDGKFISCYDNNVNSLNINKTFKNKNISYLIKKIKKPTHIEEIIHMDKGRYREIFSSFKNNKIEIIIPLRVKDSVIAIILLGVKETGDMYNKEDFYVLKIISTQSAIAINNALLYEKVRVFNKELEIKIKEATKDLREANIKLTQLDKAKSEFISIASHQLRTPLTAIKGYSGMMLDGDFGKIEGKQRNATDIILQSAERLIRLTDNLLNVSRIESGRIQLIRKEVSLEDMIDSVFVELEHSAKAKGLKLILQKGKEKIPSLFIDEEKIRQVVINLVDNSVKYTLTGEILISLYKKGNNIEFFVKDNGVGIKKEDLPNLFQKFSRGTGISRVHTDGTGLGLYVARQMIEMHNGKIWAESDGEKKGSKFSFSLPINKIEKVPEKIEEKTYQVNKGLKK